MFSVLDVFNLVVILVVFDRIPKYLLWTFSKHLLWTFPVLDVFKSVVILILSSSIWPCPKVSVRDVFKTSVIDVSRFRRFQIGCNFDIVFQYLAVSQSIC